MAKRFPPKSYDSIGDPTRTETTIPQIRGAGKGQSFRKENEGFTDMDRRRSEAGKSNKPDIYHDAMKNNGGAKEIKKQQDKTKQPQKDNHE